MRCEEIRDRIALMAIGLLGPRDSAAVREHLEVSCPACAAELAASRETLGLLPYALPPSSPSSKVKARLLAAVKRDPARQQVASGSAPATAGIPWAYVAGAAVAAAVLAALATGIAVSRGHSAEILSFREEAARQTDLISAQTRTIDSLRGELERLREQMRFAISPGVVAIVLRGEGADAASIAKIFWNKETSAWQLHLASFPPAMTGRTYQLWIVTAAAKISAGTFNTSSEGKAILSFDIPEGTGLIVAAGITEEPEGGSEQPTGPFRFLGRV